MRRVLRLYHLVRLYIALWRVIWATERWVKALEATEDYQRKERIRRKI